MNDVVHVCRWGSIYHTPHGRLGMTLMDFCMGCLLTCRHDMAVQDKSKSAEVALPPIAALFLVVFDRKVGCVMPCTLDTPAADDCCLATR